MAWNEPDNKGQDRDPWGSGSNGGNSGGNNKSGSSQKLPDLADFFRKLLGGKWNGFNGKGHKVSGKGPMGHANFTAITIVVVLVICISWFVSGLYTIRESDRGVVTRFGKYSHTTMPGLNWKVSLIDKVASVNIETVRDMIASGSMLTSDENMIHVTMNVQYRITSPEKSLFNVTNPVNSLTQATNSAVRGTIGKYTMDKILTAGRTIVRNDTQAMLEDTIRLYDMGITVLDVNFQAARPPEEVKAAFDDVIAARENEQQYIREAEAYSNEVQPQANGNAERMVAHAKAYYARVVLEAKGEVEQFNKLLTEYEKAKELTSERLYIESMEKILTSVRKIVLSPSAQGSNPIMVPLLLQSIPHNQMPASPTASSMMPLHFSPEANKNHNKNGSNATATNRLDQAVSSGQRKMPIRVGRE